MGSLSIWHWLLILLVLAVPVAVIAVAVRRVRAEDGLVTPGFKGWLFLLAASVWLTPLRGLFELARMFGGSSDVGEHFPWLMWTDALIIGVSTLIAGYCLVLMLLRSEAFPKVFPFVAGWLVLSFPLSVLAARFVLSAVYGVQIGIADAFAALANDIPQWVGGLAATIAWLVYLRRSRRVAMTFVY